MNATYHSSNDLLEAGFAPGYAGDWDKQIPTDQCFPYRRVNGAWPYLSKDVERDTTLAQFNRTGRIEKGGAVLTVEPRAAWDASSLSRSAARSLATRRCP